MSFVTYPTIYIATLDQGIAGVKTRNLALQFEYLPETIGLSVGANFTKTSIPQTNSQVIWWQESVLDDINLTVKVPAGCRNSIVNYTVNSASLSFIAPTKTRAAVTTRNSLINIAQLLYSLPLGSNGGGALGAAASPGATFVPPANCKLVIGNLCSAVGGFSKMNIKFNGPWDLDGSPSDIEVDFTFVPSEFYIQVGSPSGNGSMTPSSTMTGDSEVSGDYPYAFFVGAPNNEDQPAPAQSTTPTPTTTTIPGFTPETASGTALGGT